MDSFKIFLYLSVAVNVEIHVIYTLKLLLLQSRFFSS